ncbi:hypothetical protein NOC27_1547 [Nitrosococcus oceani AFC27]|nr:hypothetical protein NOC27_1547 [Nitrosococcus oceani AFC27]
MLIIIVKIIIAAEETNNFKAIWWRHGASIFAALLAMAWSPESIIL